MKLAQSLLLFIVSFWCINTVSAQQPLNSIGGCGVNAKTPWFEWYTKHRTELVTDIERGSDSTIIYVPVTVHIIGRDNSSGFYRLEEAIRCVCEMNEKFAPAFIRYYLMPGEPFIYHSNTLWYDHDWNGGAEMISSTRLDDRLNVYMVDNPAGNCGYSWYDAIVIGKNCSGAGNTTWSHEAGHHFSLPHPFYGLEGTNIDPNQPAPTELGGALVELLDGSNCLVAGDNFCDTRPDYITDRWSCDDNSESYSTFHDPTGASFKVDGSLYMSYSSDACQSRFSEEQIQAMRINLYTEHNAYLQVFEEGTMLADDLQVQLISPIDSASVQFNSVTFNWAPIVGADIYVLEISLSPTFPFTLINKSFFNGTTSTTITQGLPNNRLLYWRVKTYSNWDICQPNDATQTGVAKTINLSATNDFERVAFVELTPNPVIGGGIAQLSIESSEAFDALLQITDASGRLMENKVVRIGFGSSILPIETYNVPAGIYQVTLQSNKGVVVKRMAVTE
jgi:hypothetical protein